MYSHGSQRPPGPQGERFFELLDLLKQEWESRTLNQDKYNSQRHDYERKMESQLSDLVNIQDALNLLQRSHDRLRIQMEDEKRIRDVEINRLRGILAERGIPYDEQPKRPAAYTSQDNPAKRVREDLSGSNPSTNPSSSSNSLRGFAPEDRPDFSRKSTHSTHSGMKQSQAYPPHPQMPSLSINPPPPPVLTAPSLPKSQAVFPPQHQQQPQAPTIPSQDQLLNGTTKPLQQQSSMQPMQQSLQPQQEAPASTPKVSQPVQQSSDSKPAASDKDTASKGDNEYVVVQNPSVAARIKVDLDQSLMHNSVVCSVRYSADGQFLATGCNHAAFIYNLQTNQKIRLNYDPQASEMNGEDAGKDLYVRSVCFSPDGKYLVAGAEDRTVKIWNIETRQAIQTLQGHEQDIYSVDYSPDGRLIASGSGDARVRLWSTTEGYQCVHTLGGPEVGPKDGVTSIAFSADGRYIAAGSLDYVVRVWDAQTGYFLDRFEGHRHSVYSVAFSSDGRSLVSGSLDKTIRIWDVSGQRSQRSSCRAELTGHKDFVLSVAYARDNNWIISGSKDRSVQFWDLRNMASHLMLQGHKNSVISVSVSQTGNTFATGSGDGCARVWKYSNIPQSG